MAPLQSQPMYRLNDVVSVEQDGADDQIWIVSATNSASQVSLPFAPTKSGIIPAEANAVDNAERPVAADTNLKRDFNQTASSSDFLGAHACRECHQQKHDTFAQTAHHLTSQVATKKHVRGPLQSAASLLSTPDPELYFQMLESDGHVVQRMNFHGWQQDIPLDVVTGSAKAGQTFLYWIGSRLYQAHVSYFTGPEQWAESPGFEAETITNSRPIRASCLECHITYIETTRGSRSNHYVPESAIWGISCERCHGPGRQHVDFHRNNPSHDVAQHTVLPSDLSREQQLDICGQCHSGMFQLTKSAFSYRPGETLSDYHSSLSSPRAARGGGGIHTSNQLTRLKASECFQNSDMTCTTCHDPHRNQRGQTSVFVSACLQCHQAGHCGLSDELPAGKWEQQCIECHMPRSDNADMKDISDRITIDFSMADHLIQVNHEATRRVLKANAK